MTAPLVVPIAAIAGAAWHPCTEMELRRYASGACARCGGSGAVPGPNGGEIDCPLCHGSTHKKPPRGTRKGRVLH